jgi:hypothetical protein
MRSENATRKFLSNFNFHQFLFPRAIIYLSSAVNRWGAFSRGRVDEGRGRVSEAAEGCHTRASQSSF